MKISLILPPHSFEERYTKAVAKAAGTLPPLGILWLAAVAKQKGHNLQVIDGSKTDFFQTMERVRRFKPELLGISTMTFLWPKTKELIKKLKEEFPESHFIAGGSHATLEGMNCLKESPELEAAMVNEAEESFMEIIEHIEKGEKDFTGIKGIYCRNSFGEIVKTPDRPLIQDLDSLPLPARELLDPPITEYFPAATQYKRSPVTNIMSSRGCPYQCSFCPHTIGYEARYRSPEKVVEEMEMLNEKYGIRDISFWDDIFTLNRKRTLDICNLIKEKKLDIVFSVQSRVNTIDYELAKELKKAGCWKVFFGIESMVQKNLNMLRKGSTLELIRKGVTAASKAGIETEGSFIFGIPGETFEDGLTTIREAKKLPLDYAKFFCLSPYAELLPQIEKYGTMVNDDQSLLHGNQITFVPHSMTKEELETLLKEAYRQFYFRPKYVARFLSKIRSVDDVKRAVKGVRAVASF